MSIRKLLISSAITYVGAGVGIVSTMIFYMIAIRNVPTESYAALQSLLSFTFLLYPGKGVVGSYIVIRTGGDERQLPSILKNATLIAAMFGGGTVAVFLVGAPFMRTFLHLESTLPFTFIGMAALPCIVGGYMEGILNIQKKFTLLTLSGMALPLMNVVGAILFLRNGFTEIDAGLMILFGHTASLAVTALLFDWNVVRTPWGTSSTSLEVFLDSGVIFIASTLLGLTLRLDILWSKHVLDTTAAGLYSVAASIAFVLYTLTNGTARVTSVIFRNEKALRIVLASYGIIIGSCAILGSAFICMGNTLLDLLANKHIDIDWPVLYFLLIGMTFHALVMLDFTCINVLTKRMHLGLALILIIVQGATLWLFGYSPLSIAVTQCIVMFMFTILFSTLLIRAMKRMRDSVPAHPAEHHLAQNA